MFNFRTSSWKKICCAEKFVAIEGKLYQQLQYPSEFYLLFKGMVIQTTEEGLSITIHARTLLLQFKESTTLNVGSFDATSVSRRGTFFSRATQSLQWHLLKGNATLSLPSLFCFYFFSQRRYTTKLSTITRIISKSFSFTDTRNSTRAVSTVTSTWPLCLSERANLFLTITGTRGFSWMLLNNCVFCCKSLILFQNCNIYQQKLSNNNSNKISMLTEN